MKTYHWSVENMTLRQLIGTGDKFAIEDKGEFDNDKNDNFSKEKTSK